MRVAFTVSSVVLLAVVCGCQSEPHSAGTRDSDRAISSAENAGADSTTSPYLREANNFRDRAGTVESDSIDDRNAAMAEKNKAEARAHHAELVKDQVGKQLDSVKKMRDDESKLVDSSMSDVERTAAKAKVSAREGEIAALEQELKVADLEAKDADATLKASDARLATADARKEHSKLLLDSSERYARAAESDRLVIKMKETEKKIEKPMETPATPSESTPNPEGSKSP